MIRRFVIMCLAVCSIVAASAQSPMLTLPSDARSLSQGGIASSLEADGFAASNNIASTMFSSSDLGIGVSYLSWQPSYFASQLASLSGYYRVLDNLSVGMSCQYQSQAKQSIITSTGSANGSFRPSSIVFGVGAAYLIVEDLSVGVNLNYLSDKVYTITSRVIGADFNACYNRDDFALSLSANNIALGTEDVVMPTQIAASLSSRVFECGSHAVATLAELGWVMAPSDMSSPLAKVGLEYGYDKSYFARVGYSYSDYAVYMGDFVSVGVGACFGHVSFDLAYLLSTQHSKPLMNSYMLSLSYLL